MDDQPVMLHISSELMALKKAKEEATFLRSWDLGKAKGSPCLISLQIQSLNLLIVTSAKSLKLIKILRALVEEVANK